MFILWLPWSQQCFLGAKLVSLTSQGNYEGVQWSKPYWFLLKYLPHFPKWVELLSKASLIKYPRGTESKWARWSLGFSTSYSEVQDLIELMRFFFLKQFLLIHLQRIVNKWINSLLMNWNCSIVISIYIWFCRQHFVYW